MLNKTTGEFQAMLDGLKQELVIGEVTLSIARKIVIAAVEEEKRVEGEIAEVSQKIEAVRMAMLLTKPLPKEVESIRTSTMTGDRKQGQMLKEVCQHPFVFRKRNQWQRYCVVCGFEEKASYRDPTFTIPTDFKILKDTDERIIQLEPPQPWNTDSIWVPLGAVLHHFEKRVEEALDPKRDY